jgi:tetratricopeptide (TPR) repeat protein
VLHGDLAISLQSALSSFSKAQRQAFFQKYWTNTFDFIDFKSGSATFERTKRELHLLMTGVAKMDWTGGYFHVPDSSVGYTPDFSRLAGPFHDAPFEVAYPSYTRTVSRLHMPPSFLAGRDFGSVDVHETLAGIEYKRMARLNGDVLTVATSEKSVLPEISYKDALAAEPRLKSLDDEDVQLPLTSRYHATEADVAAELAEKPSSADEYFERGRILSDAGKLDEAVADFTAALEAKPKDKWSLANRGLMYVWKRNFAAAEKDLSAAESIDPTNPVLLRARGLMAEFKGECDKAVDFYTRSLAKEPDNSFAVGHRATCESDLSKDDAALADAAEALRADPSWMDLRILRANIFMRQGNPEMVAAEAEALTRENSQSDYAWVGAAMAYSALGQRDRAMQAFDRALAIKPQAFIYVNRSHARLRSDVAGRLADLDAALKLEPANPDALAAKADLLSEGGSSKAALALLEQIKAADDDQNTRQRRAILLYKLGRATEAEKLFGSIRSGAKTASAFNSLCWVKATAGILLDSALQDCRHALKLKPNAGSYLDSLGMVLLKLGKLDDALDAYNQAIAKKTGADSLMGRAFVYLKKGDAAHAQADADAARKLYPNIDDDFAEYGLKFDDQPSVTASAAKQAPTKN